jgi:hypothetical protein
MFEKNEKIPQIFEKSFFFNVRGPHLTFSRAACLRCLGVEGKTAELRRNKKKLIAKNRLVPSASMDFQTACICFYNLGFKIKI